MPSSLAVIQDQLSASPKFAAPRFWKIIEWARARIDDSLDSMGVENIITQANLLYDSYVAPVDIPWVPDVAEPMMIDAPAKQILASLIRSFAKWADDDAT
jgi:hypothetical protein